MRFQIGDIVRIARDSWDEINNNESEPERYPKDTEGTIIRIRLDAIFPVRVDFHLAEPFELDEDELRLVRRPL